MVSSSGNSTANSRAVTLWAHQRKVDAKCCSLACLALHLQKSVVLFDQSDNRGQAESRAKLGRVDEKRVRFLSPDGFIAFLDEFENEKGMDEVLSGKSVKHGESHSDDAAEGRRMLIAEDAGQYMGLATRTLAKMRLSGDSPPYFKVGRRVLYERDELVAWLAQRKRRSTSDSGSL